jgi:AraC-like DNA-binding protein
MSAIALFLIKYAFLQGLLLSAWLVIKKRQWIFAAFFLSVSYLLFVYLLEVESWYRQLPHLLWTNVPFWYMLAPLLWLQARQTMSSAEAKWPWKNILHLLPVAAALLYMLPFYTQPALAKIQAFEGFYSQETVVDYVQMGYLLQMSLYAVFGKRWLKKSIRRLRDSLSNSDLIYLSLLGTTYYLLGAYILIAAVLSGVLSLFTAAGLELYVLAFLVLSFSIMIATVFFLNAGVVDASLTGQYRLLLNEDETPLSQKYAKSGLSKADMQHILQQVDLLLTQEQLYRNPELKLSDLANHSRIPSHHISQALNQVKGNTFFAYINAQRVEAVKRQLQQGRQHTLTLMAIAESCGFRSESSFYRIFKSHTGLTPKAYILKLAE